MRVSTILFAAITLLYLTRASSAQQVPPDSIPADVSTDADDDTRPILADQPKWVTPAVYSTAGLFLVATVIGPLVKAKMPHVVPPADSHEENPAADHAEPLNP